MNIHTELTQCACTSSQSHTSRFI